MEESVFGPQQTPAEDLAGFLGHRKFGTVLADPPWRFANRTGKVAPEHRRLARYETLSFDEIEALPVRGHLTDAAPLLFVGAECPAPARVIRYCRLGVSITRPI